MQSTSNGTQKQPVLPTTFIINSGAARASWMCAARRKGTRVGAYRVKVKGVITWVGAQDALPAEFRLYDRLFTEEQPDAGGRDFLSVLNPHSLATPKAT